MLSGLLVSLVSHASPRISQNINIRPYRLRRLLFTMILLPIIQSFNFCLAIGVNFKNMPIAIKNDEVNFADCRSYNFDGCIFDENNSQTISCVVMNYLSSQDYNLVSIFAPIMSSGHVE